MTLGCKNKHQMLSTKLFLSHQENCKSSIFTSKFLQLQRTSEAEIKLFVNHFSYDLNMVKRGHGGCNHQEIFGTVQILQESIKT